MHNNIEHQNKVERIIVSHVQNQRITKAFSFSVE